MFELLFIIVVLVALGASWAAVQSRRRAGQLREAAERELVDLRDAHDKYAGRLKRKISDAQEVGHLDFVADLLPVLDALDGALKAARSGGEGGEGAQEAVRDEGLREGLALVAQELEAILNRHGVERCEPAPGDGFDPSYHEAVVLVEGEAAERVVECLRPGFIHAARVLRPAAVSVGAQPQSSEDQPK